MSVIDPRAVKTSERVTTEERREQAVPAAGVDANGEVRPFLGRFLEPMTREGIQVESTLTVGETPAEEILKLASDKGCDLIAMATHDRNILGQALMGSVTNEVIRSASMPILAITPEAGGAAPEGKVALSRIIAPLDGSEFAEAALPYVEYLAEKLALEIILVRSVQLPIYAADSGMGADTAQVVAEQYTLIEEEATTYLEHLAEKLGNKGLNVRWEMLRGAPSPNIADLAESLSDSLIALASHGRSGLIRWVRGSVAEELLRGTAGPVLVIPSQVAEGDDEDERGAQE
jgi:nucleotide-binding universal stress UspA family protein